MAIITYREALNQALREEMDRDPRVFVMGEEVGLYDGAYKFAVVRNPFELVVSNYQHLRRKTSRRTTTIPTRRSARRPSAR